MAEHATHFQKRQHMINTTYEVFRYRDPGSREVALHHHDFYEVYFFLSGIVQYNIESRSYYLKPGDVLLISPMELHQPVFGAENEPYERIVLWIDKQYLESLSVGEEKLAACFDTSAPEHTNLLHIDGNSLYLLNFQLEQLLQECERQDLYSEISALSYLVQVLILLNRQANLQVPAKDAASVAPVSVVFSVVNYINEHYHEDLSLDILANCFFTSKYHLSREFQRLVGTSVHRYIVQKRLIMAKQMMSRGASATEVYQHCGFGDYSNFYRAFKNEYQLSPKEYMAGLRSSAQRAEELRRRLPAIEG